MKYRALPLLVEAFRWFKNGDHPKDYVTDTQGFDKGELRTFTGAERMAQGWEGEVVRYFRLPGINGAAICELCDVRFHDHGWIEAKGGGLIVCPGDWIISGVRETDYPCKHEVFTKTYEPV